MSTSSRLVSLSLIAAAAALASSGCQRSIDASTPPSASTGTVASAAPVNTAAPGNAAPGALLSNSPTSSVISTGTPLTGFDKTFATTAAEGGLFEVEMGKLAKDKASHPALREFAGKLVDDHGAANDRLRQIATSHNLALPVTLPADKQKELDQLARLSGTAFDRQFIQTVGTKDHEADIALFEKASRDVKSDDLREFAHSSLPTLHHHLSIANKLPGRTGKSG